MIGARFSVLMLFWGVSGVEEPATAAWTHLNWMKLTRSRRWRSPTSRWSHNSGTGGDVAAAFSAMQRTFKMGTMERMCGAIAALAGQL